VDGQLPDRPDDAPCPAYWAAEICETRHSLASRESSSASATPKTT